jgi:SOS-response transcriptional repressor LexA
MKTALTSKQRTVLEYIKGYIEEKHTSPTQEEIARETFVKYQSVSRYYLQALKKKGYIGYTPFEPRTITVNDIEVNK